MPSPSALLAIAILMSLVASARAGVELLEPRSGETWHATTTHAIQWKVEAAAPGASVELSYTTDQGKTWQSIATAAAADGFYLWALPDIVAVDCRVRVHDKQGNTMTTSQPLQITPAQKRAYKWEKITLEAPFAPRDGAGGLSFNDRMYLIGGWNPGDKKHFPLICNNEVWSSPDGKDWTLEKPNTFLGKSFDPRKDWEGRHTAGYAVHQGKMWIVGGDANQGHYQNDVWSSADGKTWTLVTDAIPWGPRVLHYTVAFKDKLWVIGGQNMPGFAAAKEDRFDNDVWSSTDGKTWTRVLEHAPWVPRGQIGGSAVFKGRIWLLGGGTYDTPTTKTRNFYNDVWSTEDGVKWECHTSRAPWHPRQYHEVAVWDDQLWVLEGWNQSNRNDVWRSPDGVNWYEVPNTPWAVRHAASVFVHRDALWMVAGNNMASDVWKLVRNVE